MSEPVEQVDDAAVEEIVGPPGVSFMAHPVQWVRENRAKAEILAIGGLAIGGIVCMMVSTVLIIIGLTR